MELAKKILEIAGWIIFVGFQLFLSYLLFFKGGSWLFGQISKFDPADPYVVKTVTSLIGITTSIVGVFATIVVRRWFKAQELARRIDVIEAHRRHVVANRQSTGRILPNVVFPNELVDLSRFLSPKVVLRVSSITKICQRVYELSEKTESQNREEMSQNREEIDTLITRYLEEPSLDKVSQLLKKFEVKKFMSIKQMREISEEELFNDTLF